jgi:hypothetical protein
VPSPLYWVQLGPKTVVSLRGLRVFAADRPGPEDAGPAAGRLVIEPGIVFDLDARQTARVWGAVQHVMALEGLLSTLPDPDPERGPSVEPGGDPDVVHGFRPARPNVEDCGGAMPEAGVVG